jgi:hypothetical protein
MDKLDLLPPRLVPVLYFGLARVALGLACLAVAVYPGQLAAFVYQPRLLAVVHLVTLGWITASILGALYIVGPMALRMTLPARAYDYWAFGIFAIGAAGMVSHFWIEQFSGMAWSALMALTGIAMVVSRTAVALGRAKVQGFVRLHLWLAFANILIAAVFGVLLGFDKSAHVLPGYVLANVYAHAHLAAIGWATMMVFGVGYRLIPMLLPAAMPSGHGPWMTAVLLEVGVLGVATGLLLRARWTGVFALCAAAAVVSFLRAVIRMRRDRRPPPAAMPRPDYGMIQVGSAMLSLMAATVIGVALAFLPPSSAALRAQLAYGVLGLVGFLAQMVAGVELRLLPMFAWYRAFADRHERGLPPNPHAMPLRAAQRWSALAWIVAVPILTVGFAMDAPVVVRAGAALLLAGIVAGSVDMVVILRHAFGQGMKP